MKKAGEINYREIGNNIRKAAGTFGLAPVVLYDAEVKSVDEQTRTCIVDSITGNKELIGKKVRLMSELSDGDLNIPSVGETVTVMYNDFTSPIIVNASWLSKKIIIVGDQGYSNDGTNQIFNDGGYGGIPIVKDPDNSNAGLLKKINQLEQKYNDLSIKHNALQSSYNSHTHIYSPGPSSPIATATPIPTSSANGEQIAPLTFESDISNPNITHGKKLPE
jgi:hypothetical protein